MKPGPAIGTAKRAAPSKIPSLDGLRAISFGIVFLGHVGFNSVIPGPFGVTVFFFLSGYLITTLLRAEWDRSAGVSLQRFYLRRALRILPPFYVVLTLAILASALSITARTTEQGSVWSLLLHWSNYYIVRHDNQGFPPGTGVYWSLAVEEHFYLLFPALFLVLHRSRMSVRTMAGVLLALCAVVLAWRTYLWFGPGVDEPFHRSAVATDTRVDSLLFGSILALFGNPAIDRTAISERTWKHVLFPLGILGLFVCFAIRADAFRETARYSIQGLSLIPVFVCAIRYPRWVWMRPLNWRPVAFMGVLSYSLYLGHLVVIGAVLEQSPGIGRAQLTAVALAGSTALALVIYLLVEKPIARVRRRLRS